MVVDELEVMGAWPVRDSFRHILEALPASQSPAPQASEALRNKGESAERLGLLGNRAACESPHFTLPWQPGNFQFSIWTSNFHDGGVVFRFWASSPAAPLLLSFPYFLLHILPPLSALPTKHSVWHSRMRRSARIGNQRARVLL